MGDGLLELTSGDSDGAKSVCGSTRELDWGQSVGVFGSGFRVDPLRDFCLRDRVVDLGFIPVDGKDEPSAATRVGFPVFGVFGCGLCLMDRFPPASRSPVSLSFIDRSNRTRCDREIIFVAGLACTAARAVTGASPACFAVVVVAALGVDFGRAPALSDRWGVRRVLTSRTALLLGTLGDFPFPAFVCTDFGALVLIFPMVADWCTGAAVISGCEARGVGGAGGA